MDSVVTLQTAGSDSFVMYCNGIMDAILIHFDVIQRARYGFRRADCFDINFASGVLTLLVDSFPYGGGLSKKT